MVEFALILPLLMIVFFGVVDFGRIFTAGITLEAAARDGGEAAALERLRNPPPPPTDPTFNAYYENLHELAARTVCHEASLLPTSTKQLANADAPTTPAVSGDTCPDFTGASGTFYFGSPVVRVCVHDGQDPLCGQPITGYGPTIPSDGSGSSYCPQVQAIADSPSNASPGDTVSYEVEVRVCYPFRTLFNLHIALPFNAGLNLGDVWLERSRTFVVDCPPGSVNAC